MEYQEARDAEEEVHARGAQRAPEGDLGVVTAGQQVARCRPYEDAGREEQSKKHAVVQQPCEREGRRLRVRDGFSGSGNGNGQMRFQRLNLGPHTGRV